MGEIAHLGSIGMEGAVIRRKKGKMGEGSREDGVAESKSILS